MKELIVATTNQGKVKEIQAMLKDLNIEVKSLKDVYDETHPRNQMSQKK